MNKISDGVKKEIRKLSDPERARILQRFFKTGKGEYGEGDKFIGLKVPEMRNIAQKNFSLAMLDDVEDLLKSPFHEDRLTGLVMLVDKFKRGDEKEKKKIFDFYLAHSAGINNWDLVDLTAPNIVGSWLLGKDKKIIYRLARSKNMWERRIAILSTLAFIKNDDFDDALAVADVLIRDREGLIHKAVGWMLREVGKKNEKALVDFLEKRKHAIPRTMLRYAIERFNEKKRMYFLISSRSGE